MADTVTIVKTEHGKIIGGYTKYPWTYNGGSTDNEKKETFLFSLSLKEKMLPLAGNNLIYSHINYGPIFGNTQARSLFGSSQLQSDLCLSDRCNIESNSNFNFP